MSRTKEIRPEFSIDIWNEFDGWDSPDALYTRREAWEAVKNLKVARVWKGSKCVWSRGCDSKIYILTVEFAGRSLPVFAHAKRDTVERASVHWSRFITNIETRMVAQENYMNLLTDCDINEVKILDRDFEW